MPRRLLILGPVVAALLALLWFAGGLSVLERSATDLQRTVQSALAGAIRQLRAGNPGALAGLLGICFAYGFFHALGPGHGKMLIGGYGLGTRVRFGRLALIALLSSLAQATVAVLLVYAGILLFGWTRDRLIGVTEEIAAPLGYATIAAIGLWLVLRGWRGLGRGEAADDHHHGHHHHHDHGHDPHHVHDEQCGHAHVPTAEQVERLSGWRDAAALIAGVAIRPCTGALFVLILTWQMGIGASGVLGAYAMGLGTAAVALAVAAMAVWTRDGAFAALPATAVARAAPLLEITVGAVIALVATRLFLAAF